MREVENIKIAQLNAFVNNSRKHSKKQIEQVAKSIDEFGFVTPVLIDENNTVIAGHGRIEAATQLGFETVPCVRIGWLSENQNRLSSIVAKERAKNSKLYRATRGNSQDSLIAIAKGYDVIIDTGSSGYHMVLNRGALMMSDTIKQPGTKW